MEAINRNICYLCGVFKSSSDSSGESSWIRLGKGIDIATFVLILSNYSIYFRFIFKLCAHFAKHLHGLIKLVLLHLFQIQNITDSNAAIVYVRSAALQRVRSVWKQAKWMFVLCVAVLLSFLFFIFF